MQTQYTISVLTFQAILRIFLYYDMKIEKINDNQIKCTLTRSDLASRQIRLSELAYGTEKANNLFRDMMDQANLEFGFDTADLPIMIEAIPVSMDCIILMITKVEDPNEVDTRFSSLSSLRDLFSRDPSDDLSSAPVPEDILHDSFLRLGDIAKEALKAAQNSPEYLVSFGSLDDVIRFCGQISAHYTGESSLFKSPEDGRFYLHLAFDQSGNDDFAYISVSSLEFGTCEPVSTARTAYMNEHFEKILTGNAVSCLAGI